MKRIFINDANLTDADIDYEVIRVKGLVINTNNELILIENNNTFQLPGGHNRKDEPLEVTLEREIREELGYDIDIKNGPFMMITTYDPDYMNSGSRVCNKIYYYVVYSDIEPNIDNVRLDAQETETDFSLFKIAMKDLELFLNNCIEDGSIDSSIGREMLLVNQEYQEKFGDVL